MREIHLKASWVINAPRGEVYKIMSDFENMPKHFPKVAESLRIVNRDGNNLSIEAVAKSFGRKIHARMQTELRPPIGFVSDNTSEIGTFGHEEFLMDEIPEGTRINYSYEVKINNPIFRIFGRILLDWYAMRFWEHAVIDKLREMLEK